jgi:hypothetical protein
MLNLEKNLVLCERGGGYGYLFRSEFFFRTTHELEYFFFVAQSTKFFSKFNIRLYDKH